MTERSSHPPFVGLWALAAAVGLGFGCKHDETAPAPPGADSASAPVASASTTPSSSAKPDPHIATQEAPRETASGDRGDGKEGVIKYGPGGISLKDLDEGEEVEHGAGTGTGGLGTGTGRLGGAHPGKPATVTIGRPTVTGSLPSEVIQRIVRQSLLSFRRCYERRLRNNPNLGGEVRVAFVIGTDGNVTDAKGSGDVPDEVLVSCVTKAFTALSFPQPTKGVLNVVVPLKLTPGIATTEPASASEDTIGGTPISRVVPEDVVKVLKESGYSEVTFTEKPNEKGIFSIGAKKGTDLYTLTLVTSQSGATLAEADKKRLEAAAEIYAHSRFFLAVESRDRTKARALLNALVTKA